MTFFDTYSADTYTTPTAPEGTPVSISPAPATTPTPNAEASAALRASAAAIRLSFTWFGTRRAVDNGQRNEMAAGFEAEGDYLSARKKLIDTKHPKFRAVTKARNALRDCWTARTLPYPEAGIRLAKRDDLPRLIDRLETLRADLESAVSELDEAYGQMIEDARFRLGRLFNSADYPPSLVGLFKVEWDFPNVEPPAYLAQLSPATYEAERARVAQRFDEAVKMAEEAFINEFAQLVAHLSERITGHDEDGSKKVFRDSAVGNLTEFFERFKSLNLHSNQDLDELVARAQQTLRGIGPARLRTHSEVRDSVRAQLGEVSAALESMTTTAPRRKVQRPTAPAPAPENAPTPDPEPANA